MIIAHISDTHVQTQVDSPRSRVEDLASTVASINALRPRPDAVLHTGDIAQDATPSDYEAARATLSHLACPVYATVGNRDRREPFHNAFATDGYLEADDTFVQFAVDLGSLRIVAVDTLDTESYLGAFCPERELNLNRLLDACPGRPTLVFLHHPPVALPGFPPQFRDPRRAAALVRCVDQCSNLLGVFAGHVHCALTAPIGAVTLTTVPSTARDLSKEKLPEQHVGRSTYHLHTIAGAHMASARILV